MTIKTMLAVMAAPAALVLAGPAAAQDRMSDERPAAQERSMGDMQRADAAMKPKIRAKDFTMAAAHSGQFEIMSSEAALENSDNDDIKAYAEDMIAEHEAMNTKLKDVAKSRVPSETGPAQKIIVADLDTKSGDEFDKAYIKGQVTGHEMTIAVFEAMAADDDEPELQEFAQMGLPKIKQHLEEAKTIAEQIGAM